MCRVCTQVPSPADDTIRVSITSAQVDVRPGTVTIILNRCVN